MHVSGLIVLCCLQLKPHNVSDGSAPVSINRGHRRPVLPGYGSLPLTNILLTPWPTACLPICASDTSVCVFHPASASHYILLTMRKPLKRACVFNFSISFSKSIFVLSLSSSSHSVFILALLPIPVYGTLHPMQPCLDPCGGLGRWMPVPAAQPPDQTQFK